MAPPIALAPDLAVEQRYSGEELLAMGEDEVDRRGLHRHHRRQCERAVLLFQEIGEPLVVARGARPRQSEVLDMEIDRAADGACDRLAEGRLHSDDCGGSGAEREQQEDGGWSLCRLNRAGRNRAEVPAENQTSTIPRCHRRALRIVSPLPPPNEAGVGLPHLPITAATYRGSREFARFRTVPSRFTEGLIPTREKTVSRTTYGPHRQGAYVGPPPARQGNQMIALQVRIDAHPPQRRELVQALSRWAEDIRSQPELEACRLYEDLEAPGVFGLVAEWKSDSALEAHLLSESFGILQGALEVLARPAQFQVLRSTSSSLLRMVPP